MVVPPQNVRGLTEEHGRYSEEKQEPWCAL